MIYSLEEEIEIEGNYDWARRKKNYTLYNIKSFRYFQKYVFIDDYSLGKRNKNLEYCDDLYSRMAWQYDSKKFQQESDVICIPFAVPYIFQRDRASAGEPQPDACGHEQSNHKREVSNSRKNCSTRSNPIIDITKFLYIVSDCKMFENSRFLWNNFSHSDRRIFFFFFKLAHFAYN